MAAGFKTGGGSRKGVGNKATAHVRAIMDEVADLHYGTKNGQGQREIFKRLLELIDGVTVEETKRKQTRVYTKPPNEYAIRTWLDRRWGRLPIALPQGNDEDDEAAVFVVPAFQNSVIHIQRSGGKFRKRKKPSK